MEMRSVAAVILISLCSVTFAQYYNVPEQQAGFQFNLHITRRPMEDPYGENQEESAELLLQRLRLYIMSVIIPGTSVLCQGRLKCELAEYVDKMDNGRKLLKSVIKKNFFKKWHPLEAEILKIADAKIKCETIPCANLDKPEKRDEL